MRYSAEKIEINMRSEGPFSQVVLVFVPINDIEIKKIGLAVLLPQKKVNKILISFPCSLLLQI